MYLNDDDGDHEAGSKGAHGKEDQAAGADFNSHENRLEWKDLIANL